MQRKKKTAGTAKRKTRVSLPIPPIREKPKAGPKRTKTAERKIGKRKML